MNEKTAPAGELKESDMLTKAEAAGFLPNTIHSWMPALTRYTNAIIAADRALRASPAVSLPPIPLLRTGEVQIRDFTLADMQAYAQAAIAALTAERDALRKDAERYRWLKHRDLPWSYTDHPKSMVVTRWRSGHSPDEIDAAIDAAMTKEPN